MAKLMVVFANSVWSYRQVGVTVCRPNRVCQEKSSAEIHPSHTETGGKTLMGIAKAAPGVPLAQGRWGLCRRIRSIASFSSCSGTGFSIMMHAARSMTIAQGSRPEIRCRK